MTRYVKDQNALDQVLQTGHCDVIRRLPSSAVAYVDSALWPAWLRIALTEPVFLHFTTGVRTISYFDCPDFCLPVEWNHCGRPLNHRGIVAPRSLPPVDGPAASSVPLFPQVSGRSVESEWKAVSLRDHVCVAAKWGFGAAGVRLGSSWRKIQLAMDAQLHTMETELSNQQSECQ